MNPANPTVPWVAWDETVGSVTRSSSRGSSAPERPLTSNSSTAAQPISSGTGDSTRPDITFSGNTPYVTWREDIGGGVAKAFAGHFVNAANPTFVLDESRRPADADAPQADVREPISSSCIATPFNADGAGLPGRRGRNAVLPVHRTGRTRAACSPTPTSPTRRSPARRAASTTSAATLNGTVNPEGAVGQGLVPVRHDDRVRPERPRRRSSRPNNAATAVQRAR